MKAIETRYKGYRFRSRLEARWAVFFDTLGLKWEYEPEGFELGGGVRYLPDFFVEGVFAEVKPTQNVSDFDKAKRFSEATRKPILLLGGTPDAIIYPSYYSNDGETLLGDFIFVPKGNKYSPYFWSVGIGDSGLWGKMPTQYWGEDHSEQLKPAVYAARSARFEFGEYGAAA